MNKIDDYDMAKLMSNEYREEFLRSVFGLGL